MAAMIVCRRAKRPSGRRAGVRPPPAAAVVRRRPPARRGVRRRAGDAARGPFRDPRVTAPSPQAEVLEIPEEDSAGGGRRSGRRRRRFCWRAPCWRRAVRCRAVRGVAGEVALVRQETQAHAWRQPASVFPSAPARRACARRSPKSPPRNPRRRRPRLPRRRRSPLLRRRPRTRAPAPGTPAARLERAVDEQGPCRRATGRRPGPPRRPRHRRPADDAAAVRLEQLDHGAQPWPRAPRRRREAAVRGQRDGRPLSVSGPNAQSTSPVRPLRERECRPGRAEGRAAVRRHAAIVRQGRDARPPAVGRRQAHSPSARPEGAEPAARAAASATSTRRNRP